MRSSDISSRNSKALGKETVISKADKDRRRLRESYPKAWALGEKAGLLRLAAPEEFLTWSRGERDAFFSAVHLVYLVRHRKSGAR